MLSTDSLMKINMELFYEVCHYKQVREFIYIFKQLDPNDDVDFALFMLDTSWDPVLRRAINVVIDEVTNLGENRVPEGICEGQDRALRDQGPRRCN